MKSPPTRLLPPNPAERQPLLWLAVLLMFSVSSLIVLREQVLPLRFEWDRSALDWSIQPLVKSNGLDRRLIPIMLVGRYARLLIFPSHLSIDYGYSVLGWTMDHHDPYFYLGLICIAAWLTAAMLCLIWKKWIGFFCLLAMAMTYSMVSNVIIIGGIFNERFVFIPSIFLLIFLAMGLVRLPTKIWLCVLIPILCLSCYRTFSYIARWNNAAAFYEISLHEQPQSVRVYTLVMESARLDGRLDYARQRAAEARLKFPDYSHLWENSGLVEEDAGNWQQALEYFQQAFKILPYAALEGKIVKIRRIIASQDATRAATQPSP